jgi:RNA polymerase sigma-70 factor (ECF subfamily)
MIDRTAISTVLTSTVSAVTGSTSTGPTSNAEEDDASLVARVIAGDRSGFEALYQRHHVTLYRTALAITHERSVAEELLQEAFLRAFRHIRRVDLAPGVSLKPWLHRIIINLAYDWSARQRAPVRSLDSVVDRLVMRASVSPERQAEQREVEHMVGEAIAALPIKQRIVVILYYLHDMDLDEIAITLNLPPGTVKSRLYYGRARLRSRLEADLRLPGSLELSYATPTN